MTDKDFEAIYAITFEAPLRIGCMIASTPTGRRGMFYKACAEMPFNQDERVTPVMTTDGYHYDPRNYDRATAEGWKEFYFPTMVNPEWSPMMERELKNQFSAVAYEHEVLAEFGEETIGVFNKDFIDEASSKGYDLFTKPKSDGPIAIGIDWDKFGAATNIVVVQYDALDQRRERPGLTNETLFGRFQVLNRIEVPKSEMHYDNAVKLVVELDKVYNPFAIYPDRGAGEYQIEMLRKALGEKVKGVHLGSSQKVRDPISRIFESKPLKPFLVNQTVLMLERGQLRIPSKKVDETIARQMTNYQVVKISAKSMEPTYTDTDEHALDAMMFALLAFINEMPEIAETIEQIEVAREFGMLKPRRTDPLKDLISNGFSNRTGREEEDWDEPSPPLQKVNLGYAKRKDDMTWGSRGNSRSKGFGRSRF